MAFQKEQPKQQPNLYQNIPTDGNLLPLSIPFSKNKITTILFAITVLLFAAHLVSYLIRPSLGADVSEMLDSLFNMSRENNFPTYFSAFLLLLAGLLLFAIQVLMRAQNNKWQLHWRLLGFVLFFLSLDEAVQIHERLTKVSGQAFEHFNLVYLSFAWVIPYTLLFLIVAVFFARFVFALPARTRNLMMAAGILFIGGALGFEYLEGHEVKTNGFSFNYWLMITLEEMLEMWGVIILIYALLDYLQSAKAQFYIRH